MSLRQTSLRPTTRRLSAALALSTALLAGGAAAEPRFASVVPGAAPGSWTATVTGADGPVTLFADGKPVPAEVKPGPGGTGVATLSGLPAGTRSLGLGPAGAAAPGSAVALAPVAPGVADLAVYHVFVGHFANGDRSNDTEGLRGYKHKNYAGGDLQGILKQADYIASLGVTAVWLSPIFPAETDHGYDVMNYYGIGGMRAVPRDAEKSLALWRQTRDALQARGIKVILDVPLNHAHSQYDMRAGDPDRLEPKRTGARQQAEKTWEGWGAKFKYWNMDDADTRAFLRKVALYWLVEEKADGLRLDYVRGVDNAFWAELYREVKAAKPDAVLIGEAWDDTAGPEAQMRDIGTYYAPVPGTGPQFDSLFDFPVQGALTEVFGRKAPARMVEEWLQRVEAAYGATAAGYKGAPAWFLDNHDVSRLGAWAQDDKRVAAAAGFIAALTGPAVLFYGTETGLTHGGPVRGFTDIGRVAMPWDGLNQGMVKDVGTYYAARKRHAALRRGARLPLLADDTALVMAKKDGDAVALVGVNLGAAPREVVVEAGGLLAPGAALGTVAGGGAAPVAGPGGRITWTLPPVSTQIAVTK